MKNRVFFVSFLFFSNLAFSQQTIIKKDKAFENSVENIQATKDLQHFQPPNNPPTDQSKKFIFLLNSEKIINGKELTNLDPKTVESLKVINNSDSTSNFDGIVLITTKR